MSPRSKAERSSHFILTEGKGVGLEGKGVGLEGKGVGLKEPMTQLSFRADTTTVISSRYYNCHFEPKARNLAFPSYRF